MHLIKSIIGYYTLKTILQVSYYFSLMFGGKDTFKRKTKIKKDRGSSSDEGG